MKNLTRYTLEKTSFMGWRVCISRKGVMFTKYVADKSYNCEQGALEAAIAIRDEILAQLAAEPTQAKKILLAAKNKYCSKRRRKRK